MDELRADLKLFFKRILQLFCNLFHSVFVNLQDLSVVCVKTVGLVLDVADLSVDRSAKTLVYHRNDFVKIERFKRIAEFFTVGKESVAVGFVKIK